MATHPVAQAVVAKTTSDLAEKLANTNVLDLLDRVVDYFAFKVAENYVRLDEEKKRKE